MTNTSNITVNTVLTVLKNHIGKGHGINVSNLTYALTGSTPTQADERAVRKVIEKLRSEGHHICSHPNTGYYMAQNNQELDETCSYLYNRAMTSLTQVAQMKKVSLPDLRGQLNLLN